MFQIIRIYLLLKILIETIYVHYTIMYNNSSCKIWNSNLRHCINYVVSHHVQLIRWINYTKKKRKKEWGTYNLLRACSKIDKRTRRRNHLVHRSAVRYFTINATIIDSAGTIKYTTEIHQKKHLVLLSPTIVNWLTQH